VSASANNPCHICGGATGELGAVHGAYAQRDFTLRRCTVCRYAYIADPWTDFAQIYDERYYAGRGADPLVDYAFELAEPERTVRRYEWSGVTSLVRHLLGSLDGVRWMDFGCGNGGLIRFVRDRTGVEVQGFEEGSIAAEARGLGLPIAADVDALTSLRGRFDVVTAIEVLEHTLDPVLELRRMRELLRPGGLLFLTTGNAAPFAARLTRWRYVVPEIHISFFEAATLKRAYAEADFVAAPNPGGAGFDQILKFKVLKNLHVRRRNALTDLLPAHPIALAADRRTRLGEMPVGWAT
jgi:SAM-dependent methyltransferase